MTIAPDRPDAGTNPGSTRTSFPVSPAPPVGMTMASGSTAARAAPLTSSVRRGEKNGTLNACRSVCAPACFNCCSIHAPQAVSPGPPDALLPKPT
jgi:hypothetical protein